MQSNVQSRISAVSRVDNCYDSRGSLDDLSTTPGHHQAAINHRHRAMASSQHMTDGYGLGIGMDASMGQLGHDQKVINEFCHFLEKSKQLFNGLRWANVLISSNFFNMC